MGEQKNTVICCFEKSCPKITVCEIHYWIHDTLRLVATDVHNLQTDGIKKQILIKFTYADTWATFLHRTQDTVPYLHANGERLQA
jgi:hypothetical protein